MSLAGAARERATAEQAEQAVARGARVEAFRRLGRSALTASAVGFGGYRIDTRDPAHRQALVHALRGGCNLIDTSTNYSDGDSERCIGEVLGRLAASGELRRESVIVVSKVGYVQGQNLAIARDRARSGNPFAEMVEYAGDCWHCIHPEFIADQLERSRRRLALDCIDVYLLHNPEYFLLDAQKHGSAEPLPELRERFYDRVRRAFVQLEEEVAAGRIGWYGVSSNSFAQPAHDAAATSLTRMLEIARSIAAERSGHEEAHHFAVVQLPFNLYEAGAVLVRNSGAECRQTVLEFATAHRLGVLVNRPLNAFHDQRLVRLADFPAPATAGIPEHASRVVALEGEFAERIGAPLRGKDAAAADLFRWGDILPALAEPLRDALHWTDLERYRIVPQLNQTVRRLDAALRGERAEAWREWWGRYRTELQGLLDAVRAACARKSQAQSDAIARCLDPHLPAGWRGESLSRKAVACLAYTPGVSSVLTGMRTPAYVEDTLGVLRLEPFTGGDEVYRSFAA